MNVFITNWIAGKRNYTVGSLLYAKYGSDEALKQLFAKGKTDYTEKKLLEEMKRLLQSAVEKKPVQKLVFAESFPESKDKIVTSLRDQWMPLYTEMNYKRHELDKYLDDKTDTAMRRRAGLAMEILQLEKKCIHIWGQRDHYLEFNKLPGIEKPEPVVDPVKRVERLKNVQGYIRRYKMHLRKEPDNTKYIALLEQYEKEFKQLKK